MSDTQVEHTNEDIQGKLGLLLKQYREQSGHNIYEVAEALCLSPEIVVALEEEDYDSLPEPPYVRGYLRSYAKFAEVDSKDVIALYEKQRGADPKDLEYHFKPNGSTSVSKPAVSASVIRLGLLALLLTTLAGLSMIPAVSSWISETWSGFSAQTAAHKGYSDIGSDTDSVKYEIPAPLPDDIEQELASAETNNEPASSDKTNTDQDQTTAENNKEDNKESTKNDTADTNDNNTNQSKDDTKKEEDNKTITTEGETRLKFVFKSEVWMRIKDKNNKTVFESLSPAGVEKEIKLNKPMTFRIGNASGVKIFVEGKPLDIRRFTKGSVANFKIE